jgi:hypothetical protein
VWLYDDSYQYLFCRSLINISRSDRLVLDALDFPDDFQFFALGQSAAERAGLQFFQEAHEVGLELVALLHAALGEAVALQDAAALPDDFHPQLLLGGFQLRGRVRGEQLFGPGEGVVAGLQEVLLWGEVGDSEEEVEHLLAGEVGIGEDVPHLVGQVQHWVAAVGGPQFEAAPQGHDQVLLEIMED